MTPLIMLGADEVVEVDGVVDDVATVDETDNNDGAEQMWRIWIKLQFKHLRNSIQFFVFTAFFRVGLLYQPTSINQRFSLNNISFIKQLNKFLIGSPFHLTLLIVSSSTCNLRLWAKR